MHFISKMQQREYYIEHNVNVFEEQICCGYITDHAPIYSEPLLDRIEDLMSKTTNLHSINHISRKLIAIEISTNNSDYCSLERQVLIISARGNKLFIVCETRLYALFIRYQRCLYMYSTVGITMK